MTGKYKIELIAFCLILMISSVLLFSYNTKTKQLNFEKLYNYSQYKNKQELITVLEKAYLDLSNTSIFGLFNQGNLPFYNSKALSFFEILATPYLSLKEISLQPKNYEFININDSIAEVHYDLIFKNDKDTSRTLTMKINMDAKKIAGQWKLNCKEFIPISRLSVNSKKSEKVESRKNTALYTEKERNISEQHKKEQESDLNELFAKKNQIDAEDSSDKEYSNTNISENVEQSNPTESKVKYRNTAWSINGRSLVGRLIPPIYESDVEGKITVSIRVNESGRVISADVVQPTNISDYKTRNAVIEAARETSFTSGNGISTGTITYNFSLR